MKFQKKRISINSATNITSTTAQQKRVEELRFTNKKVGLSRGKEPRWTERFGGWFTTAISKSSAR